MGESMKFPHPVLLLLVVASIFLSGCSRGPSAKDVDKVVRAQFEQVNTMFRQIGGNLFGESTLTEIHEVNKLGCASAKDAAGYNCDIEIDMSAPFVGRSKSVISLRFINTNDGWRIVERW
jgi:hypothetical protein